MPIETSKARVLGLRFSDMVKQDTRVKKMHFYKDAGHYSLPFQKLTKAILDLQANRKYRAINAHTIMTSAQSRIIDWSGELSAHFSRVNSIRMSAFAKKRLLDEHIKLCKKHLANAYESFLKVEHSTIKGREFAVHESLSSFNSLSYNLDTLIQLADMYIMELDKAGYSVNHSLEAVKLTSRPERNL